MKNNVLTKAIHTRSYLDVMIHKQLQIVVYKITLPYMLCIVVRVVYLLGNIGLHELGTQVRDSGCINFKT